MRIKYKGPYEFGVFPYVGVFKKGQVVTVDDKIGEILLKSHEFVRVGTRTRTVRVQPKREKSEEEKIEKEKPKEVL